MTEILSVHESDMEKVALRAVEVFSRGGLVAFPTETVYGLGANALDETAAERIYLAKGRPSDNPLIVHVGDPEDVMPLVKEIPPKARLLMDAFWPGPLTLIFRKSDRVPDRTSGGLPTVAVRMPSHPFAHLMLKLCPFPIAAPSANRSGRPSTTLVSHVIEDLDGRVDLIIDAGASEIGVESTILDLSGERPTLLRPGRISKEELEEVIGPIEIDPAIRKETLLSGTEKNVRPKAPGMKYRHYAPAAPVTVVSGTGEEMIRYIRNHADERTGILTVREHRKRYPAGQISECGSKVDPDTVSHELFAALRRFDEMRVDRILAEDLSVYDPSSAVMNRLLKAAGGNMIELGGEPGEGKKMLAIACDHGGYELKLEILKHLEERGIEYRDLGCDSTASVDYPIYAKRVATAIQEGEAERGILICGTGIGISITANKQKGIRAALCTDCFMAEMTRLHNDANVLALGGRVVGPGLAVKIVDTFLDTPFSGEERHARRVRMIEEV